MLEKNTSTLGNKIL